MHPFWKKCRKLLPPHRLSVNSFLPAIAKLQAQNQENQTLLNSLSTANTSIKNALNTTSQTRQDISSLTQQSIDGLHSFRTTLDENLLPQLNATLDTFSSLTGELTGILNGVPATSDAAQGNPDAA